MNKSSPNLCLEIAIIPATLLKYNGWSGILGLTLSLSCVLNSSKGFQKSNFFSIDDHDGFFFSNVSLRVCAWQNLETKNHTCVSYKYFLFSCCNNHRNSPTTRSAISKRAWISQRHHGTKIQLLPYRNWAFITDPISNVSCVYYIHMLILN